MNYLKSLISMKILRLALIRSSVLLLVYTGCDAVLNIDYSLSLAALGIFFGAGTAIFLSRHESSYSQKYLTLAFIYTLLLISINALPVFFGSGDQILFPALIQFRLEFLGLLFFIASLSSLFYMQFGLFPMLEILVFCSFFVYLFKAHRFYHLDLIKEVQQIAWYFNISELQTLTAIGAGTMILAVWGLKLTNSLKRESNIISAASDEKNISSLVRNGRRPLIHGVILLIIILISSNAVQIFHEQESGSRLRNGVGEENESGMSPLTFHSALGSSSQPAALVRLEGDYPENPFSPRLYLRETVLADLKGKELVIANKGLSPDVPSTNPYSAYKTQSMTLPELRTEVVQSVYLLTDHQLSFALDYPLEIQPLSLPANTERFVAAYRATSTAPAFKLEDLDNYQIFNPDWSKKEQELLLKLPDDNRYWDLANNLTADKSTVINKISALTDYLSANVIYTLTPGLSEEAEKDPVAFFLFGNLRGYCVHFAHSLVFLFRSLGIPSRIGTGYLTDLSQSKDGHILLRMSDRHAWAEVYFHEVGWVPFDIEPAQVESHAETPVDQKLLEDLISKLGPDEELLPSELVKDEPAFAEETWFPKINRKLLLLFLTGIVLIILFTKLYLRIGWRLPGSPVFKIRRYYISLMSLVADLGFTRDEGETRQEFRKRWLEHSKVDLLKATDKLESLTYQKQGAEFLSEENVTQVIKEGKENLRKLTVKDRIKAAGNIFSVLFRLGGGKW